MYFYLIGIDHKRTPIDIREDAYRRQKEIRNFLEYRASDEAALLVTCNRIEIYAIAKDFDDAFGCVSEFTRNFPYFSKYGYIKYGDNVVFRHALRLACGLESQLQGELQILTQLNLWIARESFPPVLRNFWERTIQLSEKIRYFSGLDQNIYNIADAVFYDLRKCLDLADTLEIIVVGTGKIAELVARYKIPKVHLNFVAHKNYIKAISLAEAADGESFLFKDLSQLIPKADALISATSSPHYILKKDNFLSIVENRKHPFYLYDLAFPRDIEPKVGFVKGIYLQNLRDLDKTIQIYNQANRKRINHASELIEESIRECSEVSYVK